MSHFRGRLSSIHYRAVATFAGVARTCPSARRFSEAGLPGRPRLPPLPLQLVTARSLCAADRVSQAYQAVDGVEGGTGMSELVSKLEGMAGPKPAVAREPSGPVVQLGVFGNPDNVSKVSAALSAYGTPVVTDISVGGRDMKLMRLTALTVTPDQAIAAAEAAGIDGARLLR